MTIDEARKVAAVCETAGGCAHCVASITRELNEAFPEFAWKHATRAGDGSPRILVDLNLAEGGRS